MFFDAFHHYISSFRPAFFSDPSLGAYRNLPACRCHQSRSQHPVIRGALRLASISGVFEERNWREKTCLESCLPNHLPLLRPPRPRRPPSSLHIREQELSYQVERLRKELRLTETYVEETSDRDDEKLTRRKVRRLNVGSNLRILHRRIIQTNVIFPTQSPVEP